MTGEIINLCCVCAVVHPHYLVALQQKVFVKRWFAEEFRGSVISLCFMHKHAVTWILITKGKTFTFYKSEGILFSTIHSEQSQRHVWVLRMFTQRIIHLIYPFTLKLCLFYRTAMWIKAFEIFPTFFQCSRLTFPVYSQLYTFDKCRSTVHLPIIIDLHLNISSVTLSRRQNLCRYCFTKVTWRQFVGSVICVSVYCRISSSLSLTHSH